MTKEEDVCCICEKPLVLREYMDDEDGGYAHTDCLDGTADEYEFTDKDLALMKEHELEEADYDALYERVLKDTKDFGTLAMAAMQKHVIEDIESGRWE